MKKFISRFYRKKFQLVFLHISNSHNEATATAISVESDLTTSAAPDEFFTSALSEAACGDAAGDELCGAGGDSGSGDGALADFDAGAGAGVDGNGDGGKEDGPGAGAGAWPKSSEGRRTLSTVRIATGVSSKTVFATREESTPV